MVVTEYLVRITDGKKKPYLLSFGCGDVAMAKAAMFATEERLRNKKSDDRVEDPDEHDDRLIENMKRKIELGPLEEA